MSPLPWVSKLWNWHWKGVPFRMKKYLDQPVCFLPSYLNQHLGRLRTESWSVDAKLWPSIYLGSLISCSKGKETAEGAGLWTESCTGDLTYLKKKKESDIKDNCV